ncbi:hypothetical protein F66182_3478 [Fusarium sp. NRRL 66182]|nr:hypothetical protein F66182_3478 [Fusarium sp. NRRL 66182]
MNSFQGQFRIIVNGQPVANPQPTDQEVFPAQAGGDAAVFRIEDDHIVSGDWALGRFHMEDLSLSPKHVLWCKKERSRELRPACVESNGDRLQVNFSARGNLPGPPSPPGPSDGRLMFISNELYVPLVDDGMSQEVLIQPVLY